MNYEMKKPTFKLSKMNYELLLQLANVVAAHCHPRSCGVRELQVPLGVFK